VHWGGLSGCTYSEGVSWGKFVPPSEGGRYAEVYSDATVALPILMAALFEELDRDAS
jgi:deoxyhypusine synthase